MNCFQHDHRIELQRVMADVVEVVLKLLDCVLVALAVRIIHLRPAGDPRFHQLPEMIKWNLFLIPFGALDPLRARADQAHVALEDIPKLRQLIEPQFPQPSSGMRYAGIILPRVKIGRLFSHLIRVAHKHRAELICRKNVTFATDTGLPEDCRSAVLHPDEQENQQKKRCQNQKQSGRKEQVANTL